MRQQIIDGLTAAKLDNVFRASATTIEGIADYVLDALGRPSDPLPVTERVLDKAERVLEIEPADFIAAMARATTMTVQATHDSMSSREVVMTYDFHVAERHLAWALAPMFGVHMYEQVGTMKIAGREMSISTYVSVVTTLIDAGRRHANKLTMGVDERKQFWQTIGQLVATTETAKRQTEAAKDLAAAAKEHCQYLWGTANVIPRPKAAENGDPVFQLAASAVAEVAAG